MKYAECPIGTVVRYQGKIWLVTGVRLNAADAGAWVVGLEPSAGEFVYTKWCAHSGIVHWSKLERVIHILSERAQTLCDAFRMAHENREPTGMLTREIRKAILTPEQFEMIYPASE